MTTVIAPPNSPWLQRLRRNFDTITSDKELWLRAFTGIRISEKSVNAPVGCLARLGSLEVRLASNATEVRAAQKLRYNVFYGELSGLADLPSLLTQRDVDPFDAICDHLIVLDHASKQNGTSAIVGTYRLLRQRVADRYGGFYSGRWFDINGLLARSKKSAFLELGRSCVLPGYRHRRAFELLWSGIWRYVRHHGIEVLMGCASFQGTDPDQLTLPLSFLHHFAAAPEEWSAKAIAHHYVGMNRMVKAAIDPETALESLPPLIRAYVKIGGFVGDGAVIDGQLGTTVVFIVMPVRAIKERYVNYFTSASMIAQIQEA